MSEIVDNVLKSFSFLCILIELSKGKKMTGYEIMVHISSFGSESHAGTVYHQLGMLSEWGFIKGEEQETRTKYANRGAMAYEMTKKGIKAFRGFKEMWREPIQYVYQNIVGTK